MAIELSQSDLAGLEAAAGTFGSSYQNLGRGSEYFSMTSFTLNVTFSLNDLNSGYQVLLNNFGQYSIAVKNDNLVIQLNTENGQDKTYTFNDAITDSGWHDVQVIVNDQTGSLEIWLDGETLHTGSSEGIVIEDPAYWDVTAGGTPWGAALNGEIADVTVLDYPVTIDPEDGIVQRMENIDSDAYAWDANSSTETPSTPDVPAVETPTDPVVDTPVETPTTGVEMSDLEILQAAATEFGSGYQNLGKGDEYFSMTSMTLSVTFSLDSITNTRQVLLNNFGQYALMVKGDTLTVELNQESGTDLKLTFDDLLTETGWHDIQVIVDADTSTLQIWFDGGKIYSGSSDGIVIEDAKYWDVTAGGTPWGSNLNGQIAAVTVLDEAVTIDPNDSLVERMQSIDGQGDGTGSTTVVDTTPDNGTTTDPVVDTNVPADSGSNATITGTSSGDVTEDVDLTSSGKLTATDPNTGESGFQDATENGDYGNFAIDGNGNWTYTLTNSDHLTSLDTGDVVTETFTVQTIDGTTAEVVVNVNGRDEPVTNTGGSTNTGSGGGTSSTTGDIEVSSTAELIKALSGNVSGYTIVLAPGEYDTINLNGYNFSSPVTITSANPDNPAHFESITVSNSSNMVFDNLDISSYNAASGSWGEYLVTINNSSDIVISDSVIGNDVDGAIYGGFIGAIVKNSQDITIENTEFHNLSGGAGFISSNGVNVIDSEFYDIRSDGITFSGVQDVMIDGNYFHDFYHLTGDHSDYVQFWATAGLQANEDILIKNNLMVQGDGYDTQGIFMTATSDLPLNNVVIENNVIYQSGYHGISISTANDVSVSGNTVISPVDSASGYEVWISLSNVTNGVVEDNISNSFIYNSSSVSESGNVVAYGSTVPWNAGNHATSSYDDIFVDNNLNIGSVDAADFMVESGYNVGADVSLLQDGSGTSSASATTVASTTTTSSAPWNEGTVGNDHIEGTAAVDEIFGFDGNDELIGFGGNDYIIGGGGADKLTGGTGSDTFVYTEVGDSGIGAGNRDVILDFDATNGDHLSFEGFATPDFDYSFNDSTDVLSIDLNGDFVIDMEIQLIGVSAVDLDSSDFLT